MARNKLNQTNIDDSDLANYPNGRIENDNGSGNGTPVNEAVYGDIHETLAKAMRLSGKAYNGLPDNETNGYQFLDALLSLGGKNDLIKGYNFYNTQTLLIPVNLTTMVVGESIMFKSEIDFPDFNVINQIRGTDNQNKTCIAKGRMDRDTYFMLHKIDADNFTFIKIYSGYDYENLAEDIGNISTRVSVLEQKLGVLVEDGAMLLWNKPIADIPAGWQEVTDWRGKVPLGVTSTNPTQIGIESGNLNLSPNSTEGYKRCVYIEWVG